MQADLQKQMEVRPLKQTSKKRTSKDDTTHKKSKHLDGCQCNSASEMCSRAKACSGARASRSCSVRGTK